MRRALVGVLVVMVVLALLLALGHAAEPKAKPKREPGRWALLVGVDDYTELGKLKYAGNDQRALAEQFIAAGFPKDQVYVLHDKAEQNRYRPFRENIEKQLELVLGLADQGDLVIVGFSGHGVQLEGKSYLCPVDARLDKLTATSIRLDSVYDRLAKSKATLKLLLVDACRNDLVPAGRRSVALTRSVGEFAGSQEKPPEGIMLLASCGAGQVSMEDEAFGHGVFMHFLLEGLGGKAAGTGDTVSLAGLYDYASLETKKYVARKFNEYQTPAMRGDINGPFEICSRIAPQPITNSIGMKMVLIPAGEFMMGAPDSDKDASPGAKPQHRVRITQPFYLGSYHVTRGQFRRFVEDTTYKTDAEKWGAFGWNPETKKFEDNKGWFWRNVGYEQTDDHPVVAVSWNDAVAFCEWLSRKEGKSYRLPTEAEWEYACRAGTTTRYYCGDDPEGLAQVGNVADASAKAKFSDWSNTIAASDGYVFTSPVGSFRPNAFGLYDMLGNAVQWCADVYGYEYYATSPTDDPAGPGSGSPRVYRGSSWSSTPASSRSSSRSGIAPGARYTDWGFRVARTP